MGAVSSRVIFGALFLVSRFSECAFFALPDRRQIFTYQTSLMLLSLYPFLGGALFLGALGVHAQCPERDSSTWRQNVQGYVTQMEELQRKKPGFPARLNTYDPCRPITEGLECDRKRLKSNKMQISSLKITFDESIFSTLNYLFAFFAIFIFRNF